MKGLKVERVFSPLKRWAWLMIIVIAVGGLYWHFLGLLLLPMMVALLITGFLNGKYWCGNVCPHGSLFDGLLLHHAPLRQFPKFVQNNWFRWAFFAAYMVMFIRRIASAADGWGSLVFWDRLGLLLAINYLIPTTLGILLGVANNPRVWCTFCPMGMIQEISNRTATFLGFRSRWNVKVTISNVEACRHCGKCSRVCPMQLEPHRHWDENSQFSGDGCIRCAVCTKNCPFGLLSMDSTGKGQ